MESDRTARNWRKIEKKGSYKNKKKNGREEKEKKKEWEVRRGQRRGEENRRGMLCWRTGRGKPQEGPREGGRVREE